MDNTKKSIKLDVQVCTTQVLYKTMEVLTTGF